MVLSAPLRGQDTNAQTQDSTKTGVALGRILLDNPNSIVTRYEYDAKIDRYVYTESVGDFNVNYPLFLTPEQYYELVQKESMKAYFKEKIEYFRKEYEQMSPEKQQSSKNFVHMILEQEKQ